MWCSDEQQAKIEAIDRRLDEVETEAIESENAYVVGEIRNLAEQVLCVMVTLFAITLGVSGLVLNWVDPYATVTFCVVNAGMILLFFLGIGLVVAMR